MPTSTFPPVPILGRRMIVGDADAQGTVVCRCASDNPPLLILSVRMCVECSRCGTQYAIESVHFDRLKGDVQARVVIGYVLGSGRASTAGPPPPGGPPEGVKPS